MTAILDGLTLSVNTFPSTSPRGWARALRCCGVATAKRYVVKLRKKPPLSGMLLLNPDPIAH